MLYFDPLYLIFILPSLFIALIANILLKVWTGEYLNKPNTTNLNGHDTVQRVATLYNLNIRLLISPENLSDHYNPSKKELVLSRAVAQRPTIGAVAITAHELGHARQHQSKSLLLGLRSFLVPAVNIGTNLGYFLIILGIILSFTQLAWVGVIMFSLSTLFSLLTLPIEIDASRKAIQIIRKLDLLDRTEIGSAKKVLTAASLTYVAASISSLSSLAYFIFRVRGINNRD